MREINLKLKTEQKENYLFKTIAFTSGKGGVGKSSLVINIGLTMAKSGLRVAIMDGDLGLANVDIILGLTPKYDISHVMNGEKEVQDILLAGPNNLIVIPASSGRYHLANLKDGEYVSLFTKLAGLKGLIDILLIDTCAGIASNVVNFLLNSDEVFLITTPDPAAITDAYAVMKIIFQKKKNSSIRLIVNMVDKARQGRDVYNTLQRVVKRFLDNDFGYAGYVVKDPCMIKAIQEQKPLIVYYPFSQASQCINSVAATIMTSIRAESGNLGVFWREIAHVAENFY